MKVSFELSPKDIRYFREQLRAVRSGNTAKDEDTVIRMAEQLVEEATAAEPPEFVLVRLVKLEQLIDMLRDEEWRLQGRDRARILDALAYFVDPDDMIPDKLPGIGYLDDAIMVELVVTELGHELEAYEDFCQFRTTREDRFGKDEDPATRQEWIISRRKALHARMRRRRSRRRTRSSGGGSKSPLSLW